MPMYCELTIAHRRYVTSDDQTLCALLDMYPDGDPDPEVVRLKVGQSVTIGGGAAPESTITRVA